MYGVGRTPLMLAAEARDLDELSDGRLTLGLGNGTQRMVSEWHGLDGRAPAKRMEELVPLLRSLWRLDQAPVDHQGQFYRVRIRALDEMAPARRRDIPVYTAGVNPWMIETADRVADGFLGHTLFTPRCARSRPWSGGRRTAGGTPLRSPSPRSCLHPRIATRNRPAAMPPAMTAFYGAVSTYGGLFSACGFGDEARAIPEGFTKRDSPGMVATVSDSMIDEFSVPRTPAQVKERLTRFDGLVDEVIPLPPSFRVDADQEAENLAMLTAHCGPDARAANQELNQRLTVEDPEHLPRSCRPARTPRAHQIDHGRSRLANTSARTM